MKQLLLYITLIAFMISASSVYAKGQIYNIKPKTTASQDVDQTKQIAEKKKSHNCNECCE